MPSKLKFGDDATNEEMAKSLGSSLKKLIGKCIDKHLTAVIDEIENEINLNKLQLLASERQTEKFKFALLQIYKYPVDRTIKSIIDEALK